jgi:hypothetical protein
MRPTKMNESIALAIAQSKLDSILDPVEVKDLELLRVSWEANFHWYSMRDEQPILDMIDRLIQLKKGT